MTIVCDDRLHRQHRFGGGVVMSKDKAAHNVNHSRPVLPVGLLGKVKDARPLAGNYSTASEKEAAPRRVR
jgi:hypothetical protein